MVEILSGLMESEGSDPTGSGRTMFKSKARLLLPMAVICLLITGVVSGDIYFRDGDVGCDAGDTRLYSLAQSSNSHAFERDLGNSVNVDVCSDRVTGAEVAKNCDSGYEEVLAFAYQNNSHVGTIGDYAAANYKLCLNQTLDTKVKSGGCYPARDLMGKMAYLSNSHIGTDTYSAANYNLCILPPPSSLSSSDLNLSINHGDIYTASTTVDLQVSLSSANADRDCYYRNNSDPWTEGEDCTSADFEKIWTLNDQEGVRNVSTYEDINGAADSDVIVLDTYAPNINCDNCYTQFKTNITFNASVQDPDFGLSNPYPSGLKSMSICSDSSCSNLLCSNNTPQEDYTQCTVNYSQNLCTFIDNKKFWVKGEDNAGNYDIIEGGSFSLRKPLGCTCSSDLECMSGWCYGGPIRVCTPRLAPRIYLR